MKVRVEGLTKRYNDVIAVDNLTAEFESGKLIALLGPSGCGKTTMLNMLSGILPVSEGKIYFDDVDVTDLPPEKREVGLVFQNYALYPHMTVLENICFPLKIKKRLTNKIVNFSYILLKIIFMIFHLQKIQDGLLLED